jgi:transketolase C-terminal domain/subunit
MRHLFVDLCKNELRDNPNFYVLLGDIGVGGFLNHKDTLADRVINMGIAEQAMVGFGSGMSSRGADVILHTISPFLVERALEQIKLSCGYNKTKLILISANGPYDYDKLGPTHHCASDVNILSTVPNLQIRVPATLTDFKQSFQEALLSKDSFYIRMTSRVTFIDDEPEKKGEFKCIYVNQGAKSTVDNGRRFKAVVCVGEALAFYMSKDLSSEIATVFWCNNPRLEIPQELIEYEELFIFEPYFYECLSIPKNFMGKNIVRKNFKVVHKKEIIKNLGWEDFNA